MSSTNLPTSLPPTASMLSPHSQTQSEDICRLFCPPLLDNASSSISISLLKAGPVSDELLLRFTSCWTLQISDDYNP